jgi:hypothetical protein
MLHWSHEHNLCVGYAISDVLSGGTDKRLIGYDPTFDLLISSGKDSQVSARDGCVRVRAADVITCGVRR